jgi:hypothetical protein
MSRAALKDSLIVIAAGLIAPIGWIGAWGLLVAFAWMPLVRVGRPTLEITDRSAVMGAATVFDVLFAAAFALAITIPLARLLRRNHVALCFLFIVCAVATTALPTALDGNFELLSYFFTRPMVWSFFILSVVGFAIGRRRHVQRSVA